jgi:hypothetical protein
MVSFLKKINVDQIIIDMFYNDIDKDVFNGHIDSMKGEYLESYLVKRIIIKYIKLFDNDKNNLKKNISDLSGNLISHEIKDNNIILMINVHNFYSFPDIINIKMEL